MDTYYDVIARLLSERFGIEPEAVRPDLSFAELAFDSLALLALALAVEEEVGLIIDQDELTPDHTVTTTAELLAGKAEGLVA
jgi:acyl carrier protein